MKPFFEYSDTLNNPYDAFYYDSTLCQFPILAHWHYFIEIIYMLEGSAYIEIDHDNYVLEKGDLMFIHPKQNHGIYSTGKLPIQYGVLKFDAAHLNIANSALPKISHILQIAQNTPTISGYFPQESISHIPMKQLFDSCVKTVSEKQFGYDVLAHSYYSLIVMELIKIWVQQGLQLKQPSSTSHTSKELSEILEYINNHAHEPIKIENLASMCHMSYSHFAKEFKQYYGQTCKHYLLTIRLQKAKDLLRFTDYDLNYISQETGFSDCSHLIHCFKKKYGITPKQYRLCLSPLKHHEQKND